MAYALHIPCQPSVKRKVLQRRKNVSVGPKCNSVGRSGDFSMPLEPKPNCTLDTNCIIALEEERDYAGAIRNLISMHEAGQINLRVVGISASEKQPNGKMAPTFSLFKDRLTSLGLGNVGILIPPAYTDISYIENCYLAAQNGELLEAEIHFVLWPNLKFKFFQYEQVADKTNPNWKWKWINRKCDTLAFLSHVMAGSGLFVSNDKVFHGQKKATLLKFAGGDIAELKGAIERLLDPTPFEQMPEEVAEFLRVKIERVDPKTVPAEFERIQVNYKAYEEQVKQHETKPPGPLL